MQTPAHLRLLDSPRIRLMILILCAAQIIFTTLEFAFPIEIRGAVKMKDYDAFHVAGRMFWEGILIEAYQTDTLFEAQRRITGTESFMPWTYPPQFNLVTAVLALMPVWLGYALFTVVTFVAYVLALRRLAGPRYIIVMLALFPAMVICIRTGQNGFLIGALLGLFAILMLDRRTVAGLPLALLTIKPHYLPGIGLYLLFTGQWRIIALGAGATAVIMGAATLAFGADIWPAFLAAIPEAGYFLELGAYPLFRMTSVYAAMHTLGLPPAMAMAAQLSVGLAGLGVLVWAWRRGWPPRQLLGVAVMGSLFFSPYAYDYDLPILGVALALLMPDLIARGTARQIAVMLMGCWATTFASLGMALSDTGTATVLSQRMQEMPPSLGAWVLIPVCLLVIRIIRQPEQA
ncbi:MAG TPA: glycosyltransferase family 87 protein [Paracoccaceae bacterium]|nr:glycosyltransferase family 87 protein [Paracoccaceae bacterium]